MKIGSRLALSFTLALPLGILASGAEAQEAQTHVGHVTTSFSGAPGGRGLTLVAAEEVSLAMMHANFAGGDLTNLEAMKTHVGHVLHLLDPVEGRQGPGLGVGVKRAAEDVARHIEMAAAAPGASETVRTHAPHVALAARSVSARATEMQQLGQRVLTTATAAEAAPLVEQLRDLALQLDTGFDRDGNGRIDLEGEAGMNQLEAHVYLILEGERQLRVLQ
jgi:hypothetical protein